MCVCLYFGLYIYIYIHMSLLFVFWFLWYGGASKHFVTLRPHVAEGNGGIWVCACLWLYACTVCICNDWIVGGNCEITNVSGPHQVDGVCGFHESIVGSYHRILVHIARSYDLDEGVSFEGGEGGHVSPLYVLERVDHCSIFRFWVLVLAGETEDEEPFTKRSWGWQGGRGGREGWERVVCVCVGRIGLVGIVRGVGV